jgi:hypothetical protein
MFVILNVYDAKNSNIGSVAICRHLTIWLALGIPKRIICYHCSNWTNRRNDLTGPEDPIYYSDRVIWLCVLLLLMVKGFDYWNGTTIPQIELDYLTMLNTGQYIYHIISPNIILLMKSPWGKSEGNNRRDLRHVMSQGKTLMLFASSCLEMGCTPGYPKISV